ncbi:MAG TPA: dihydroorotase, partial [Armatimonadota bacterium]|nr:dihydroorotase [Armatimonadota bacterium]
MTLALKDVVHQGELVSLLVEGTEVSTVRDIPGGVDVLDGRGMEAVPALWDAHVHFREPGNTDAEDLLSGARAAAAGGYGA